jgi:hypothetical protein
MFVTLFCYLKQNTATMFSLAMQFYPWQISECSEHCFGADLFRNCWTKVLCSSMQKPDTVFPRVILVKNGTTELL